MKVCIDDAVTVECSHVWLCGNGWVSPVFTKDQLDKALIACGEADFIVYGLEGWVDSVEGGSVVVDLGEDEWTIGEGWCWDVAEWDVCDECHHERTFNGCEC